MTSLVIIRLKRDDDIPDESFHLASDDLRFAEIIFHQHVFLHMAGRKDCLLPCWTSQRLDPNSQCIEESDDGASVDRAVVEGQ